MMNRGKISAIACTILFTTLTVGAGDNCRYSADLKEFVSTNGVNEVVIDAGAGFLIVKGVTDSSKISATGRACSSRENLLDEIQIVILEKGNVVKIKTEFPRQFFNTANTSLDLEVTVPDGVTLTIKDGSGRIDVNHVAAVDISDGSGAISVTHILGNVSIDDGSGEIIVKAISGDVSIDDGSGTITVKKVEKNVEIRDGSGEIDVRDVSGTFRVVNDGSGSIEAERIGGDFIVERDGSGSIDYDEIIGNVEIPRD